MNTSTRNGKFVSMRTFVRLVVVMGGLALALELGSVLYPVVGGVGAWIVAFGAWFALIGVSEFMAKRVFGASM